MAYQRLLAAYGTLMRPFGRIEELGLAEHLSFISSCRLMGELYDMGRFPGAVPGDGVIHGELFRVKSPRAWTIMDAYEGYRPAREDASLFVRRQVKLRQPTDQRAWVYWFNGDPTEHSRVPSGCWITHMQNGGPKET